MITKKVIRKIVLCCLLCSTGEVMAQGGIADSLLRIDSVTVVGKTAIKKASVGTRIATFDKAVLSTMQTKSLSELLLQNSAIQIKTTGQGGMSTVSLRGTASSHTKILWNGISVNSPTTGDFDLSEVPLFFTDNVSVTYGASAQNSGSGALGGTIDFSSDGNSVNGVSTRLMGEYGSNNTVTGGVGVKATIKRFTTSTRLFYQQSDNNYKFLNTKYSKKEFYAHRENADYSQTGVLQEFFYKVKNGNKISSGIWWQYNDRNIPQTILTVAAPNENLITDNLRSFVRYEGGGKKSRFRLQGTYLTGTFDYKRDFGTDGYDTNKTHNRNNALIGQGDYSYDLSKALTLTASGIYRYDNVKSDRLSGSMHDRHTISGRLSALYKLSRRVHLEGQGMVESVNGKVAPTYNLGVRYHAIDNLLTFKASNAYNYRFPGLNDLYWEGVGNPDLEAERGFSWDATMSLTPQIGRVKINFETSAFYMDIDDWIMWVFKSNWDSSAGEYMGSLWVPVNFDHVVSKGFELTGSADFKIWKTEHKIVANYAYTNSRSYTDRNDNTNGKQLPYMPLNKWSAYYNLKLGNYWINYNVSFTDLRYVSADQRYFTPKYTLHNAEIGGRHRFGKDNFVSLTLRVDNLFDAYYESTIYCPMPLRMYLLRLNLDF